MRNGLSLTGAMEVTPVSGLGRAQSGIRGQIICLLSILAGFFSAAALAGLPASIDSVTASSNPVVSGAPITYTIQITAPNLYTSFNLSGSFSSSGFAVGDISPINQSPANWNCLGSTGSFSCDPTFGTRPVGELPAGTHTFTLTAVVSSGMLPDDIDLIINCSTCINNFIESVSIVATPAVPASLDLTTSTSVADPIASGANFDYLLSVNNIAAVDAQPFLIKLESTDIVLGMPANPGFSCNPISSGFECTQVAGILVSGASTVLVFPAIAPTAGGPFAATASLYPGAPDQSSGSPFNIVRNVPGSESTLQVTGNAPVEVRVGDTISLSYHITNIDDPSNPLDGVSAANIRLNIDGMTVSTAAKASSLDKGAATQYLGFSGLGWLCVQVNFSSDFSVSCNYASSLAVGQSSSTLTVDIQAPGFEATFHADATPSGDNSNGYPPGLSKLSTNVIGNSEVDLILSKTASADSVDAGAELSYFLRVTNLGPETATNVSVREFLPPGMTVKSTAGTGWTCVDPGNSTLTCRLSEPISRDRSSELKLTVNAPRSSGVITNRAVVRSDEFELTPADNEASVSTTVGVVESIDLSISKLSLPVRVEPGASFQYQLLVSNLGLSDATGVVVTDVLPADLQYVAAAGAGWSCAESAGNISCTLGQLAAGATATFNIDVIAPLGETTIVNSANVNADQSETNADNNHDSASTTVERSAPSQADISLLKLASQDSLVNGDALDYTLNVINAGPEFAANVNLTDNLPTEFRMSGISASGWDCIVVSNQINCQLLGDLAPGQMATVGLSGRLFGGSGVVRNTAVVSADTADPDQSNNTGFVDTMITAVSMPADLKISMVDNEDPVRADQPFSYAVTVGNEGPGAVPDFMVAIVIDDALQLDSFQTSPDGDCGHSGNVIHCNFVGDFGPNDERLVMVQVTAPQQQATVSSSAEVSSFFQDPELGNNLAIESTRISSTPTEEQLQEDLQAALGNSMDPVVVNNLDPIANLCSDPFAPFIATLCREIVDALDDGRGQEVAEVIRQIVGQQTITQHTSLVEAAFTQFRNIDARLAENRGGTGGFSMTGLSVRYGNEVLPMALLQGAGDDETDPTIDSAGLIKPWGFFINGLISVGEKDPTTREIGFEFDTLGITAGIDYRFSAKAILGVALGYADFDSDYQDGGALQAEGLTLTSYASFYPGDNFYIDGRVSYGAMDFTQDRVIRFSIGELSVDEVAIGNTKGDQFSASLAMGLHLNPNGWSITPSASATLLRGNIDSFAETGTLLGLDYVDQDVSSFIVSGALSVSKPISLSRGILIPQFDFSYSHEFQNDQSSLNSLIFGASLGSTFLIDADDPDVDYGSAGVGLVFVGANGKQAYLTYRSVLGLSGFSRWMVNVGFRFEF